MFTNRLIPLARKSPSADAYSPPPGMKGRKPGPVVLYELAAIRSTVSISWSKLPGPSGGVPRTERAASIAPSTSIAAASSWDWTNSIR